ncbi:MAG: hypothetical protein ABGY11_12535 [Candidatus Thioglobus sp.]|jgi:hypothetical protein
MSKRKKALVLQPQGTNTKNSKQNNVISFAAHTGDRKNRCIHWTITDEIEHYRNTHFIKGDYLVSLPEDVINDFEDCEWKS